MKNTLHTVILLLLVGCATRQPSQVSAQIDQAIRRYQAVTDTMTRDEVYRSLGQPQKAGADGSAQWRTSDGRQAAVLSLSFTPDGKIASRDLHVDDPGPFVATP